MADATHLTARWKNLPHSRAIAGVSVGWLGLSMIADGVPTLLLPYRLSELGTGDASLLGVISLVALAVAALVQPLAGRWSDVVGRPPILAAGVAISAIGLVLLVGWSSVAATLAGVALTLLGVGVAQAGQQALLPDYVAGSSRGVASGVKNAFDVGGALLGFVIIGTLLSGGSGEVTAVVLIAALAGAVAVGLALLGRGTMQRPRDGRQRPGLRGAYAIDPHVHGRLLRIIAARFLFLLGVYVVGRFLFLFVAETGGLAPDQAAGVAGTVLVILAAATVVASLPAGWLADRGGRRFIMLTGALTGAAALALLPWAPALEPMIAVGLLLAAGTAAFSTASWAALVDEVTGADSGRLLGVAQLGTAGAAAAAGAFGVVIDVGAAVVPGAGYAIAFGVAAACAATGGLLAWRTLGPRRVVWGGEAAAAPAGVSLE